MASTAYFEIDKNELAKVGHRLERLGVHLLDSTDRRGVVINGARSSLVSKVKKKCRIKNQYFRN